MLLLIIFSMYEFSLVHDKERENAMDIHLLQSPLYLLEHFVLTIFSVFSSQGHGQMKLDVVATVLLMSLLMYAFSLFHDRERGTR